MRAGSMAGAGHRDGADPRGHAAAERGDDRGRDLLGVEAAPRIAS